MTFMEKLRKLQQQKNTMLCVGLDTDRELVPVRTSWAVDPVLTFNKAIIEATAQFVCAYKLNIAFYSVSGWQEAVLKDTIDYIHEEHPDLPVILDAKRGDIAHTAQKYAQEAFDRFKADAVTVSPYLGQDSCQPLLDRADKGMIVLCKSSNPGAKEFQDLLIFSERYNRKLGVWIREEPVPLYQKVAHRVAKYWNQNGNCALVVGAIYPQELKKVRQIVEDLPILVPGIGSQGGDLQAVIKNGLDSKGFGLIINVSRGIIYASKEADYVMAAARKARRLRDQINKIKEKK